MYLRTILELNKEYGFNKFMIVVPSIAIRKGVEKSMEQLADHFKRLYNVDIQKHSFIYDSNNPKQISSKLVESNDLSICVLNIQAFNKTTNKIRKEDEYGQNLWEDIKYIRGIELILERKDELISFDEPLAFVFSHSALREGWDNPNVFTLCTLKAGGSEIAKKQEIGRGLRLPVDITGNR